MRPRRRRVLRGFVIAEALVSTVIASLAVSLALALFASAVQTILEARASRGATRALQAVYEQARLETPDELGRRAFGRMGRYGWSVTPKGPLDRKLEFGPQVVRMEVRWAVARGPRRVALDAIILPGGGGKLP